MEAVDALPKGEPPKKPGKIISAKVAAATRDLAARDGPIVTLHAARPAALANKLEMYNTDLLLDEVTISVNTAAAGGNASLMATA